MDRRYAVAGIYLSICLYVNWIIVFPLTEAGSLIQAGSLTAFVSRQAGSLIESGV